MTGVLENSINTGMVYVAGMLGRNRLTKYIQEFGFGTKTGIELDSESPGTVNTLLVKKKTDKLDCDAAVSSFGQSIMVTPIQMATAFSALVNGGILFKPFVVKEIDYSDGRVQKIQPREIKRVISNQSSLSISSMLVSVVEKGHSMNVKIPGYYLGGKTGTAQIAGAGGYSEETNQSFVGFGPAEDPKFVLLIKFEKPQRVWADSTAAPVFRDIAQFVLQYYQIPPTK
jgi:cell division protein FtsI/penicillin-binding protein 2